MREIISHHVKESPETVRVFPEGDPDLNGAPILYRLAIGEPGMETGQNVHLRFTEGRIKGTGKDLDIRLGLTNESLLAVLIDRLEGNQKDDYACRENAVALTHLETALLWLQKRTRDRVARGVSGKAAK